MQTTPIKHTKNFIIVFLCLFIFGGQPAEFGKEEVFFLGYSIEKPIIRIGLGVNLSDIRIRSTSGMDVYEVNSNFKLVVKDADEIFVKGREVKLTEKFVIQVAQTKKKEDAQFIAQDLGAQIENIIYVTEDLESRISDTFQVKVGDFFTRSDALSFVKNLNQLGIKNTWILREEMTEMESKLHWLLANDRLETLSNEMDLYIIPSCPQSYLSFNGRNYRGIFVLRGTSKGPVLINVLNIEDYLKGVVPSELSPYNFNELEAHKAQAVAARTYAIRNLGMNQDLGFDLCDSPKSQFYQGMNVEHLLSTKAVELTQGEVGFYNGKLINALYTSTCGGMTEDVENIFEGPAFPYLKSTECVYEKQNEELLESKNILRPVQMNGDNIIPMLTATYPPMPNILEVSSALFRWQTRVSREKLEDRINQYYPVGTLIDIVPQKKGISERVVELSIIGTESQAVVKGFRIRRILGLRETLFVIDREYDEEGHVTHFTFLGRGLGHGVGLCQVGAFGLARSGENYKDILKKYYHGITISKIYSLE